MSRASTGREKHFNISGSARSESAQKGNLMAARCALIAFVAHHLGHTFVVEQPQGSLLEFSARFQWLMENVAVYGINGIHLGAYGGLPVRLMHPPPIPFQSMRVRLLVVAIIFPGIACPWVPMSSHVFTSCSTLQQHVCFH
jgi:hypothetical protein